jgi:uncharacterized protein involved in exopolysaccharide biosynthesis
MTFQSANADIDDDREGADEGGLDLESATELLGFVWRSAARRPKLALAIFVAVAGAGLAISLTMPRLYGSQVKLLVQRDLVGPALSNPGRAIPHDADVNPARNVVDMIMRRDNLIALVKETNLVDRWQATRPWALRLKDRLSESTSGPISEEDRLTSLAQTLEKRLSVVADEATVTIGVDWQDPAVAYELVTLVQKNFIESRYDAAVTAIQDAIHVLEDHARSEGEQVDTDLTSYQAAIDAQNGASSPAPAPSDNTVPRAAVLVARPAASATPPDPELAKALEEKQRQIRVLEEQHDRELEGLKQQLFQAQLTLTPQHPTVIALQQRVDTLSKGAPDLLLLKSEERALLAQIALARAPTGTSLQAPFGAQAQHQAAAANNKPRVEDPRTAAAHAQLEASIRRYQDVIARLDSARLELDITRTTYRYRYSVVTPAEVARRPTKRTPELVGVASVLAGVLLALLGAAAADYRSGRILEAWQVRRRLKLELIGELDLPA